MPAAAVAIPLAISAYQSYKSAQTPSAAEQGASAAQTSIGQTQQQVGEPALKQAGGYFQQLAGGNRQVMTQALAPQIGQINDVYGGTARTLSRFTRGPTQGVQMAESERERGGQIGNLFSTARAGANTALAGIGQNALGGAAGVFGQQAGQAQASRFGGAKLGQEAGQGVGGLLFNLMKSYGSGGFGKGKGDPSGTYGGAAQDFA